MMGLRIGMHSSNSSCSSCQPSQTKYVDRIVQVPVQVPNPDPNNFKVLDIYDDGYIALLINYPDCTNYEGNKILVFDNTIKIKDIINLKSIDPHFCDGGHISPIARFEPTKRGWSMAIEFIKHLKGIKETKPIHTCPRCNHETHEIQYCPNCDVPIWE
jgi:anaerobic ribonucleoside-triphosphate reductase